MIGKQVKGQSFRGVLNYLHHKEQAQLIGGNMVGQTPRTLAAEFGVARALNPQLTKAVYHASLSLPKDEQLDASLWNAIATDYINGMGFENSQYVVYRHGDKDHDHIHIVASRIRISDGTTVSDSWDYPRSEKLIRSLEKQYDLTPVPPSKSKHRKAPTTGERRRFQRTGDPGVRGTLQATIDQATAGQPPITQLIERLQIVASTPKSKSPAPAKPEASATNSTALPSVAPNWAKPIPSPACKSIAASNTSPR
jgi:hypothetical protein